MIWNKVFGKHHESGSVRKMRANFFGHNKNLIKSQSTVYFLHRNRYTFALTFKNHNIRNDLGERKNRQISMFVSKRGRGRIY